MMEIILCLIATVGLTKIMVDSVVMLEVREWLKKKLPERFLWFQPREAVECYQYMGTWCGFMVGLLYLMQSSSFFVFMLTYWKPWIAYTIYGLTCSLSYVLLFGFASSFLSELGQQFFVFLLSKTEVPLDDKEQTSPPNGR